MLLSLAVDAESHPMSFRYLSQADVFNVSITRARDYQIVFTLRGRRLHGRRRLAIGLERCRMFARAGLSLFPLPLSAWERDQGACYRAIEDHWRSVASRPGGN